LYDPEPKSTTIHMANTNGMDRAFQFSNVSQPISRSLEYYKTRRDYFWEV